MFLRALSTPILILPLVVALGATCEASDPTALYALVDKVVFEPDEKNAERVRVEGAFCLAQANARRAYEPPASGYLYLALVSGKEKECRNEWNDLKSLAGSGRVVGLGSRWSSVPRLRTEASAKDPDPHPLHFGLRRLAEDSGYDPNRWLRYWVRPEKHHIERRRVTLTVRNCHGGEAVDYLFEVESETGRILGSGLIEPGKEGTTEWRCPWICVPGKKYRWRVRSVPRDPKQRHFTQGVATATFQVPKED